MPKRTQKKKKCGGMKGGNGDVDTSSSWCERMDNRIIQDSLIQHYYHSKNADLARVVLNSSIGLPMRHIGLHRILTIVETDLTTLYNMIQQKKGGMINILSGKLIQKISNLINNVISILHEITRKVTVISLKEDVEDPLIDAFSTNLELAYPRARVLYEEIIKYVFVLYVSPWGIQIHLTCRPLSDIIDVISDLFEFVLGNTIVGHTISSFLSKRLAKRLNRSTIGSNPFQFVSNWKQNSGMKELLQKWIDQANDLILKNRSIPKNCTSQQCKEIYTVFRRDFCGLNNNTNTNTFPTFASSLRKQCTPSDTDVKGGHSIIEEAYNGCYVAQLILTSEYKLTKNTSLHLQSLLNPIDPLYKLFLNFVQSTIQDYDSSKSIFGVLSFGGPSTSILSKITHLFLPTWGLIPECYAYSTHASLIPNHYRCSGHNDVSSSCRDACMVTMEDNNTKPKQKKENGMWEIWSTSSSPSPSVTPECKKTNRSIHVLELSSTSTSQKWKSKEFPTSIKFVGQYSFVPYLYHGSDVDDQKRINTARLNIDGYVVDSTSNTIRYYNAVDLDSFSVEGVPSDFINHGIKLKDVIAIFNFNKLYYQTFEKTNYDNKLYFKTTLFSPISIKKTSYFIHVLFAISTVGGIESFLQKKRSVDGENEYSYIPNKFYKFKEWINNQSSFFLLFTRNPMDVLQGEEEGVDESTPPQTMWSKVKSFVNQKTQKIKQNIGLLQNEYTLVLRKDKRCQTWIVPQQYFIPRGKSIPYTVYSKVMVGGSGSGRGSGRGRGSKHQQTKTQKKKHS